MATREQSNPSPLIPQQGKHIAHEGHGDYGAYYDGQLLGYRPTRLEAEELANSYVYDLFQRGMWVSVTDLMTYDV